MDEGVNTFSTARVESVSFPPSYLALRYFGGFVPYALATLRCRASSIAIEWVSIGPAPKSDPPASPSYLLSVALVANAISYAKTALWLKRSKSVWAGRCQRIMASYFSRGQFNHPKPADFFETASTVAGHDLGWFFDQVYRSSNVFDYGVQDLQSTSEGGSFRTSAVIRRYGEGIFPVGVRVTFANGDHVDQQWDGRDRWKVYTYDRRPAPSRLKWIRIVCRCSTSSTNNQNACPQVPGRDEMVAEVDGMAQGSAAQLGDAREPAEPAGRRRRGIVADRTAASASGRRAASHPEDSQQGELSMGKDWTRVMRSGNSPRCVKGPRSIARRRCGWACGPDRAGQSAAGGCQRDRLQTSLGAAWPPPRHRRELTGCRSS
jgi:hypothetical protein